MDLVGYGKLLGLSPRRELNTMATMRYRLEFGEPNIFSLPTQRSDKEVKHEVAPEHRGATLFGAEMTYARLASLLSQGRKSARPGSPRNSTSTPTCRPLTAGYGRCLPSTPVIVSMSSARKASRHRRRAGMYWVW